MTCALLPAENRVRVVDVIMLGHPGKNVDSFSYRTSILACGKNLTQKKKKLNKVTFVLKMITCQKKNGL